ncbi:MAG: aspartate/glutamate racemase family protein [Chloroflexi bacterium]|nr:aspartate/glutamate racemase family protein [Chloroflexota bacterium]
MGGLVGGRPYYALPLGIMLLDARFPRPPGDIAYAETFDFPVLYRVVPDATPDRVVNDAARGLVDAFCAAARQLEADGVRAICTSCGFLALHQAVLAASVSVPFFSSSLLQIPTILRAIAPTATLGVLTISRQALTPTHFAAVGVDAEAQQRLVIAGLEEADALYRPIIENRGPLVVERAEAQVVDAARSLVAGHPRMEALVLECTNLPPYASAIQAATGLPVWDAISLVRWVHSAVRQRPYARAAASGLLAERGMPDG